MASEVDFNSAWNEKLAPAISDIYNRNATSRSFEELYRTSYYLVVKKKSEQLYKAVQAKVSDELNNQVDAILAPLLVAPQLSSGAPAPQQTQLDESVAAISDSVPDSADISRTTDFIIAIKKFWSENSLCIRMTSDVMAYLDKAYCTELRIPTVHEKLLELFRECVLRNEKHKIGSALFTSLIELVNLERDGQVIDRMSIKSIVQMLENLPWQRSQNMLSQREKTSSGSVYKMELEPLFVTGSAAYYDKKIESLLAEGMSMETYVKCSSDWLQEESNRCGVYLSSQTTDTLIPVLEKIIIADRTPLILASASGFAHWLESENIETLALFYTLQKRSDASLQELRSCLESYLNKWGIRVNQEMEESRTVVVTNEKGKKSKASPAQVALAWIESLLERINLLNRILIQAFDNDRPIQALIDTCLTTAINLNSRAPEYLSLYVDDYLRKGIKGQTDDEIQAFLTKSIALFRYLADKDQFELYYRIHLAKRLLHARALSDDAEKEFVGRLRVEVGSGSTAKLEGIFKDMRVSRDHQSRFREYLQSSAPTGHCDLNVNVLTSTYWPSQTVTECMIKLPEAAEKAKQCFESFYQGAHCGRLLKWNCNMGTADIRARYGKRIYEVNMATPAMAIIMLFSTVHEDTALTFNEIQQRTEIAPSDLVRHLQSLSLAPKTRLLKKDPHTRTVNPTDLFSVNKDFTSPTVRFKVLSISNTSKPESDSERKTSIDELQMARKYEIDAAIVRVMKSRKQLEHALLVSEVTRMLAPRFKPDPIMIKQQINLLVDKEYLERDSTQRNLYHYLA